MLGLGLLAYILLFGQKVDTFICELVILFLVFKRILKDVFASTGQRRSNFLGLLPGLDTPLLESLAPASWFVGQVS